METLLFICSLLLPVFKVVLGICVIMLVAIGTLFVYEEISPTARMIRSEVKVKRKERKRQAKHRKAKEEEAWASYFFDGWHHGFDSTGAVIARFGPVISEEALRDLEEMRKLDDAQIFENTQELDDDSR